jgi:transposase InsO family protein
MPWKETCAMDQRTRFVIDCEKRVFSKAELCRMYGISRPTGDKWLARYGEVGIAGLKDWSRAPRRHPNQISEETAQAILDIRRAHMRWGPKKLKVLLEREWPERTWPSQSTIGQVIKDNGLSFSRKIRRRTPAFTQPFSECAEPNAVWCADFKGWFKTGDGSRCDPLTITDAHSRFILRCQAAKDMEIATVRGLFEAAFREFGLPMAIKTDNGTPFASRGIFGLSKLSVWWMKLGILPERIEPGKPQQNGRHERMHSTLKAETAKPPKRTLRAQQRCFDLFRDQFNCVRPHEALEMKCPSEVYCRSALVYPERLGPVEYPRGLTVRIVQKRGEFYWNRHRVFLGEAFGQERIGLEPVDGRYWFVYYTDVVIGIFDSYRHVILPLNSAARLGIKTT